MKLLKLHSRPITDTLDRVEFVDPETGERTAPKQALENLA